MQDEQTGKGGVARVARDERGERTAYESIEIGQDLGSLEWVVTPELIEKQCAMDGDYDAFYALDTPYFGGPVAPPQISYRPPRWLFSRMFNVRGVFCRWEMENIAPIRPGTTVTVQGKITNKWIKGDREFVEFEASGSDPEGKLLFWTRRVHVLDVVKRTAPRAGVGLDSGKKAERM
ncbi:MAG: hypothetical protein AB7O44_24190 [Hyphomicrobiaceae bacterium]